MVKVYLKYVQQDMFGVIASTLSLFDQSAKMCITGCGERIGVWNLKRAALERWLFDEDCTSEVSCLALSRDASLLAAGHTDGSIRLWNLKSATMLSVFNGHRGAISCLEFNSLGSMLVSGSRDTEAIVWDIITESGLYRLRGHRDMVTGAKLLEKTNHLVTSSKDGLIKIWELETQHCIQTIVGHRNPVWAIDVNPSETRLVSVTSDNLIRCWRLDHSNDNTSNRYKYTVNQPINAAVNTLDDDDSNGNGNGNGVAKEIKDEEDIEDQSSEIEVAKFYGTIPCKGESYNGIKFDPTNRVLMAQSNGKFLDLFKITSTKTYSTADVNVLDEYSHTETVKTSSKIRGFSFGSEKHWNMYIVSLMGNSVQAYEIKDEGSEVTATLDAAGHRADVRALSLSTNDALLASTSSDSVKIWNVKTLNCIRTFACEYGLCCLFVPGNLHIVVGTKTGTLEVFELASAEHVASIQAHSGAIWSLALTPDLRGVVSGGSDKTVKFWNFELHAVKDNPKAKRLTLKESQTLQCEADVMCVRFSKDNRFLAVSLLDNTVKIFHSDTLRFHLSLYGHKLPVMSMDISDDSTLIITGSADKNIKIWGLDYGDCHKSLFAHDDSIMQLAFIPKTHHFISTSKDKRIKYWDADKFEHIQTVQAHHGEVWALAMGSVGTFFLTGSHDRSIRVFKQTTEPVFVESEKQATLEKEWETTLEDETPRMRTKEMLEEHASANKKTLETIIAGEAIMDALSLAEIERGRMAEHDAALSKDIDVGEFTPNILLFGMAHSEYLWTRVAKVRASELEEALLVLPYSTLKPLFTYFCEWLDHGKNTELISKCLFFLVQTHHNQLSTEVEMVPLLKRLNDGIKVRLQHSKDTIGFNRSAMSYLRKDIQANQSYSFFEGVPTSSSSTTSTSTTKTKESKIQSESYLLNNNNNKSNGNKKT
ncbi:hypothetical protein SAMD00019534_006210, partial [Acytostelium subglobosum LB1]|uniref:hypothetical protein n=1 Tax=Acytostelium subglobosum LB1 TaxID=1410327 RepID=UPI000644CCDD